MKLLTRYLLLLGLNMAITTSASALVITFDEFAADNINGPMPADRYDYLGVTFVATDDGTTWGGLANGDPGNWDLEGTNGSIFSGFNGNSDGLSMLFSTDVLGLSLDASRSAGSTAGDTLTLEGWNDGFLVESLTITFSTINDWTMLSLSSVVDEVRWVGNGVGFNPYGIDNIQWDVAQVPEPPMILLLSSGLIGLIGLARRKKV